MGTEATNDKEPRFLFFVFSREVRETKNESKRETHLGENGERVDPASWKIGRASCRERV